MQIYNLVLIPSLLSACFVLTIGYLIVSIHKTNKKEILNPKIKTIISYILFISLLISEVFYAIIVCLNLQDMGVTEIARNMFSTFVVMSALALILKFFVGYYFFQKIPYTYDYIIQQGGWLGEIVAKSKNVKIPERQGYSHRGGPVLVFLILGISIVEGIGILGLISALNVLETLK